MLFLSSSSKVISSIDELNDYIYIPSFNHNSALSDYLNDKITYFDTTQLL